MPGPPLNYLDERGQARGIVRRSLKGDVVFSNEKGALARIRFQNELEIPIEGGE